MKYMPNMYLYLNLGSGKSQETTKVLAKKAERCVFRSKFTWLDLTMENSLY
jgi:hypothetical protein